MIAPGQAFQRVQRVPHRTASIRWGREPRICGKCPVILSEAEDHTPLAQIRARALAVDGTLTDGGVFWGPDGQQWKRFCFALILSAAQDLRFSKPCTPPDSTA